MRFCGDGDVGENGVVMRGGDYVGIGFYVGAGGDTEKSSFRINGAQRAVGRDVHPRDVVADCPNAIALGKAAAIYVTLPEGSSRPRMSMCSAIQPCSWAIQLAMRSAKHFFPSRALPP